MTMTMLDTCCELLLFFMSSWLSAPQFNIIPIVLCYKSSYLPKLNNKNMRQCDRWVVVGHTPHISYDIVGRWNFVDGLIWLSNHCAIQLPFFFVLRCAVHRDHEHADLNRWTCQFSIVDDIVESCNNEWMLNKTYTYVRRFDCLAFNWFAIVMVQQRASNIKCFENLKYHSGIVYGEWQYL